MPYPDHCSNYKVDSIWSNSRLAYFSLALSIAAVSVPYWLASLVPAADLAQHLTQIQQLRFILAGHDSGEFEIARWYFPNTLVYLPLALCLQAAPPLVAGKIMMVFLSTSWIAGSFLLAWNRRRSVLAFLITVPIAFNFLFNWGLLNFLVGWPIFCWLAFATEKPVTKAQIPLIAAIGLLLYYAHILWFIFANLWLISQFLRRPRSEIFKMVASVAPGWGLAAVWYPSFAALRSGSKVDVSATWISPPSERIDLPYLGNSIFGVLHSNLELIAVVMLLCWCTVAILTNIRNIRQNVDTPLILAGLSLTFVYLFFPDRYLNTLFFNSRWLPCAISLIAIGLPPPTILRMPFGIASVATILMLSIITIHHNEQWEREQLDGFFSSLRHIKSGDKVLGLNFLHGESDFLKGRPGLHLFVYASVLRGATVNFYFAEHYAGIVHISKIRQNNEERNLVWHPGQATKESVSKYDFVLVNATEELHALYKAKLGLTEVTQGSTRWRLYRPESRHP